MTFNISPSSYLCRDRRRRIILWTALIGLLFGVFDLGRPIEDYLQIARDAARRHDASGDIIIIAIDDRSLNEINSWPWPRRYHGELAERLDRMGASRILFDIDFSSRSTPQEDARFAAALARLQRPATLAMRFVVDPISGERTDHYPIPEFRRYVELGNINVPYDYLASVRSLPYALDFSGRSYPSLAARLSGNSHPAEGSFRIDYSIDPATIPVVSAVDLLRGAVPAAAVRGKKVIVGTASLQLGDVYFLPGYGQMPGAYLHALGAETLTEGQRFDIGWFAPFLLALLIFAYAVRKLAFRATLATVFGSAAALAGGAVLLEGQLVLITIVPSLIVLVGGGSAFAWKTFRLRGTTSYISGLPNFNALRENGSGRTRPLIVAKIRNYAEIVATFPADEEKSLVGQIAGRLRVGAGETVIYHGDDGVFSWFASENEPHVLEEHLDGLHHLFKSPVTVSGSPIDLTATFGLETSYDRPMANRLGSALFAAEEAAVEGLRWKRRDGAEPATAAWKLSLLSQLDSAIDSGDFWVAYQPKFELASMRMIGAEALARWTHPEKGQISPLEFIMAAEQNGRIDKLTSHVLDRAIRAAAAINRRGMPFEIAVNVSARLITDDALTGIVTRLLGRHHLDPSCLTLEVTETAAMSSAGNPLLPLHELRAMGVNISIDDYGTGLSTLEYIKRIPATEIKIDRGFIQSINRTTSDRLMVQSTIQLAHSLGQKVVAEGVEDAETLQTLIEMGCDLAQGFYLGKPMTYRKLVGMLRPWISRKAA